MKLHKTDKIIILIILLGIFINNRIKYSKICLCTIVKYENKYIIEFVEHYKKYGVDKIFLYDNNDLNGENLNFLKSKENQFIEIIDYRGISLPQIRAYNDCYKKNYQKYNWLLFFDVDEYIFLNNFSNIHNFLSLSKFNKCQSLYLNWLVHTDNNIILYNNRSLFERFPTVKRDKKFCIGKSIIRGNLKNINICSCHLLDLKLKRCDSFGRFFKPNKTSCKTPDYKYNYIHHFKYKSLEEFIEKIKIRGDGLLKNSFRLQISKIRDYFKNNKATKEKINYISKNLHINSTYIKTILFNHINKT